MWDLNPIQAKEVWIFDGEMSEFINVHSKQALKVSLEVKKKTL